MSRETNWHPTACILCSLNCGIEVQIDDGHFTRIRGDKAHPSSKGYLCQKAARLDYYPAEDLVGILRRSARLLQIALDEDCAGEIARRDMTSTFTPSRDSI